MSENIAVDLDQWMAEDQKTCPVDGCIVTLGGRFLLMCRSHWRSVPGPVRERLRETATNAGPYSDWLEAFAEAVGIAEQVEAGVA